TSTLSPYTTLFRSQLFERSLRHGNVAPSLKSQTQNVCVQAHSVLLHHKQFCRRKAKTLIARTCYKSHKLFALFIEGFEFQLYSLFCCHISLLICYRVLQRPCWPE